MLERRSTYRSILVLTNLLLGCISQSDNSDVGITRVDSLTSTRLINDSVDYFKKSIDSLIHIDYFISGKDSVKISSDPVDFVEMNSIKYCFQSPTATSDFGLRTYREVDKVRKYHVAKNKKQNGPSANIIEISFVDAGSASRWFEQLTKCKDFGVLKMKPKTEIWIKDRHIYFIQSYYDPDRQVLTTITDKFKQNIK